MKQPLRILILLGSIWFSEMQSLKAQTTLSSDKLLEQDLAQAEDHLKSFRNDIAISLTGKLLKKLKAQNQVNTSFGIRVQLVEADAYEKDEQNELALQKTLQVQQKSRANSLWEVHARASLVLALLYEKTNFSKQSREQLALARADIDRYGLNVVYPYYAIRRSSWERIYGNKRIALVFAHEASRTALECGLLLEEAISHMLLTMLLPKSSDKERLYHCLTAIKLYQKLGDYEGASSMFSKASNIYLQRKEARQALAYNDSAIVQTDKSRAEGNEHSTGPARNYKQRSRIYEQMRWLDSALVSARKSHQLDLAFYEAEKYSKIVEIESRYQNQHKQEQIEDQQLTIQLKNNQLRFSIIIVALGLGSALGLLLAYRKQRQARQKLLEQNILIHNQTTQLKQLDAAKSRFFANVSHELRTPLTLLLGPIGTLLSENQLTNKQTSLLRLANRNGKQLDQLITDILDLGKLELGKMELDTKPTPLAPFFRSHLAQFESLAESRRTHYSFQIDVPDDAIVTLDQVKCHQILNNLLSNAFKFTPADGYVTVTLTLINAQLNLCIADSGLGIHPDDRPHLFDRYFQTNRPEKPAEGGTGIGLALCHEYVQLFRGIIDVDSTPGSGSVFRISFPVSILPPDAHYPPDRTDSLVQTLNAKPAVSSLRSLTMGETDGTHPTHRPTILVVEDNSDLQTYIRLILAGKYHIMVADNGQDALEKLSTTAGISLILSDLMMPVMDGHQLLEHLKANDATRHIPVIILTARADVRDKLRALRIGVDDYLLKPFDEAELLARIANLLANQTIRQQVIAETVMPEQPQPVMLQADREWLETFEQYIQHHLPDNTLSIPDLAYQFAMSESTLLRQLKRLTGLSSLQYVQAVRLEEARRLLESHTNTSVAQVATKVGYTNARSFSRNFQTRFGKLPSDLLEN